MGYCIHGESRFLVYELMENGSLETQLHGTFFINVDQEKIVKEILYWELNYHMLLSLVSTIVGPNWGSSLTWHLRLRIAVDVARWVYDAYST